MRKLIIFCSLFISAISIAQDLSITHTIPTSAAPGTSKDVEFTINKGALGGFAKFQCELPVGFTAVNIDSKSGNFTFENQRVKIVWVSVPSDASFTFKLTLNIPGNAVNTGNITGKFFYLENNVKKEFEMPVHTIKFETGDAATTTSSETPATTTTTETPVATTTTETPATTPETPATTTTETPVATTTETPATTTTETPVATTTETPAATTTTETPVATTTTETPATTTETPATTTTETPVATTTTETPATTTENSTSTSRTTSSSNTSENSPSGITSSSSKSRAGLTYKVQLGAFSHKPSKSKFPGTCTIVEEGGYYKVLSGNFSDVNEVIKHQSNLFAKGYRGFIVAYQNGQRVKLK